MNQPLSQKSKHFSLQFIHDTVVKISHWVPNLDYRATSPLKRVLKKFVYLKNDPSSKFNLYSKTINNQIVIFPLESLISAKKNICFEMAIQSSNNGIVSYSIILKSLKTKTSLHYSCFYRKLR